MPKVRPENGMQRNNPLKADKFTAFLTNFLDNCLKLGSSKNCWVKFLVKGICSALPLLTIARQKDWVNYQKLPYGKQIVQSELYDSGHLRGIEAKWEKVQFL